MHDLNDMDETQRIIDAGYIIESDHNIKRIYNPYNKSYGINMTRTIGDFMFKFNLSNVDQQSEKFGLKSEPDIGEFKFSDDKNQIDLIVMGCDGIWDGTMDNSDKPTNQLSLPPGYQVLKFLLTKIFTEDTSYQNI